MTTPDKPRDEERLAARRTRDREARFRRRFEAMLRATWGMFVTTHRPEWVSLLDVVQQATDRALSGEAGAADDLRGVATFLRARNGAGHTEQVSSPAGGAS